jgi:hypothetical protein
MADLEAKLDLCIDRLQAGEDLESVLRSYPESADELRTLLQTAKVVQAMSYAPSAGKKLEARRRFESARAERSERVRSKKAWFARPLVWGMVATAAVVVFAVYIGVRPAFSPGAPVFSDVVPVASPTGNFAFLVSDEVNAIAEFSDVTVDISKIGIQQSSDGKWIEISPSMQSIDLTKVPGDLSEEIWRGDLPPGSYSQAFVYVDNVSGELKSTGQRMDIKLPSQRLHLSIPFAVSETTMTSFTFDMSVFRTGNSSNARYILKPQIGESGARQSGSDRGSNQSPKGDRQSPPSTVAVTPSKKTPRK